MGHLSQVGDFKREEGTEEAITELKSLSRGYHIENNSADNSKMSGSLLGRIVKTFLYGKDSPPST